MCRRILDVPMDDDEYDQMVELSYGEYSGKEWKAFSDERKREIIRGLLSAIRERS